MPFISEMLADQTEYYTGLERPGRLFDEDLSGFSVISEGTRGNGEEFPSFSLSLSLSLSF
jgi:hypothetical protein